MNKRQFERILDASKKILREYDLCDYCLGRMFAKKLRLKSNHTLGKRIRTPLKTKSTKCYVCKNIFDSLKHYLERMTVISEGYDFKTFNVGAKIKPSILDRDDHIRSKFQLKGAEAVKTSVTREIARQFAKKTKKKSSSLEPDVVFTVDFKTESCDIRSKSLFLFGHYTKQVRDVPQKQKPCQNCHGKGCVTCTHHGIAEFDSVEGMISRFLFDRFGATQAKITWIGGEDSSSLVLGRGRPFFVKLLNPKKRNVRLAKKITSGKIDILNLKQIRRPPAGPVPFASQVRLLISAKEPIRPESLEKLDDLEKSMIVVYDDSGKRAEKSVSDVAYEVQSDHSFALSMTADGGLPLKHFVSGGNVFPNVSDLLGVQCICDLFDFQEVRITNQHFLHHD